MGGEPAFFYITLYSVLLFYRIALLVDICRGYYCLVCYFRVEVQGSLGIIPGEPGHSKYCC
jgi:hypothetical protein